MGLVKNSCMTAWLVQGYKYYDQLQPPVLSKSDDFFVFYTRVTYIKPIYNDRWYKLVVEKCLRLLSLYYLKGLLPLTNVTSTQSSWRGRHWSLENWTCFRLWIFSKSLKKLNNPGRKLISVILSYVKKLYLKTDI